jgi:hypothetical protein
MFYMPPQCHQMDSVKTDYSTKDISFSRNSCRVKLLGILRHIRAVMGSNLSPETGYYYLFSYFQGKGKCVPVLN